MSPRKFWYFRALRQLLVQPVAKILIELLNNLFYTKYRLGAVADIKSFLDLGCKHVQKVGGGGSSPPPHVKKWAGGSCPPSPLILQCQLSVSDQRTTLIKDA